MKYDLLVFQNDEGLLNENLVDDQQRSFYVTGIRKAAQSWLLLFLNARGSSRHRPGHGSIMIPQLRSGSVVNEVLLRSVFYQSDLETRTRMRALQPESTPSSERLVESTLLSVSIVGDQATLRVQLNNELGDNRTIDVPVQVLV